jgi:phage-related protein
MLKLNTVKQDGTHNTKSVCDLSTDKKNTRETGNVIQVVREYKTLGSYRRIYVCEAESIVLILPGRKRKSHTV